MPVYNSTSGNPPITSLAPGDIGTFVAATDSITAIAAASSVQFALAQNAAQTGLAALSVAITWSATPAGSTVNVQTANQDVVADYVTVASSAATQNDLLQLQTAASFVRVTLSYSAGTSLNCTVVRR